ncbi:DNA-3-methyladenine glycosylase I [Cardiobacteriaceae bacterium TAE3-ERU3]|nr:DNA-3-methyladenine glycosylase I [Cardiobacteriaceae bacterium TAE3-ERU3]
MGNVLYRCAWANNHPLETEYHDAEWGIPINDDRLFFEMLTLESAQSGLSWLTILKKREGFRQAFDNFEIEKVAEYKDEKVLSLLDDTRVIRHKQKILATINNAKCILALQSEYGSFSSYLWKFVDNQPIINCWENEQEIPASTQLSDLISKELKQKGFKFFGTTTCYAFMQATGIVNDHVVDCFRFNDNQRV